MKTPKGFTAGGIHCGIRKNSSKLDLALIYSEAPCAAACVYTQNLVKGAPITVTRYNVSDGYARAVICNSGNANTCNADGIEIAEGMCKLAADALGIDASDVVVASTGVIGQPLSLEPVAAAMPALKEKLSEDIDDAATAIMTTDTMIKEACEELTLDGKTCRICGIAKGSGMIHPNMATMLVFIVTDAAVSPTMLNTALASDIGTSFNMLSIDGDTSTNDMVSVLANGAAGNKLIDCDNDDYKAFKEALNKITVSLCRAIAKDGEGATKLLECRVTGAKDDETAKTAAKSVICSSLVKAAMFGSDANWGRVLCALGYSGADIDVTKIDVGFISENGSVCVCKKGSGIPFDEDIAKNLLSADEIIISVALNDGNFNAVAWGCDLTYDYVKINGDYRT